MMELGFFIKLDFRILTKRTWAFLRCSFVCGTTELLVSRATSRSCPPPLPTGAGGSWKWPDGRDRSLCTSSGHFPLSSPGMSPGKQCQGGEDCSCPCGYRYPAHGGRPGRNTARLLQVALLICSRYATQASGSAKNESL